MNNNHTTPPLPPGQQQPQLAHLDVAQHPHWSHFQAPTPPPYHPQGMVPQSLLPPSEQSAFNPNYDYAYGSQWHGQQYLYHVPSPMGQPHLQVAQPNYNSYQPTAGYPPHYVPQPVASPKPQPAYYHHPQQQQHLYHTPDHLMRMPARRQLFDNPNLNRRAQPHAPPPPSPPFPPSQSPAQNTGMYPDQSQGSGRGDGDGNVQHHASKERRGRNRGGKSSRGRGTRGGSMLGNKGEITDSGQGGSRLDSGIGGKAGQSGDSVHAHGLGGHSGGAKSLQAKGSDTIPTSAEPVAVPVATQLQGAQVTMSGNPRFTNIGVNKGKMTTVNNYGGSHGLEKLERFVSFSALHDSAEQDPERRCHPGTRETVLRRLRDWFDNPNPTDPIIWLHGPAGAGKSAIAQTIADEYKRRGVAASFFFYRSDPSRTDGNRLFPTIAWQLAFSIPPTKDFIVHALDETPHLPTQAIEPQFEHLVAHPFQPSNNIASQMLQPAPVVIIDGVDECSDEKLQQRVLAVIGNAVKNHHVPLRFLIASRPEVPIEDTLDKFKDFTISIDLAKLDDSNRDIHKYLEDKFSEVVSNRGLDPTWPGQEIIEEIVSKSSGNFIFASLVIRFISDEDFHPEILLNIVRNLMPRGNMSPFALLDELFLEILKRQRDQDFLKTFLAILVARSSIELDRLHEDDAALMNVSEKDLHIRLRRMRSLLKFEPFIDVHHKSFLDFLQDPSRSGEYHVTEEGGQRRYMGLMVDSVVRHVSMAIEQPKRHGICRSSPVFKSIVRSQPPKIVLHVDDWQEALKPLLDLQDKLLKISKIQSCRVTQVMRDLLLHLVFLRGNSHPITTQAPESNVNETATERRAHAIKARKNDSKKDLDSCFFVLLSRLQKTNLVKVVDRAIIDRVFSLLAFDYTETVARVRTLADAQKLIDSFDLLANNESFHSQCGPDAAWKVARLASEIFARVPLLPQSLCWNKRSRCIRDSISELFELECQSAFISRILNHNYIIPVLGIFDGRSQLKPVSGNETERNESVDGWLRRSSPNLVTRIRVVLEVAKVIRYIHSMDVVLYSRFIRSDHFFLNSNLHTKFKFMGLFAWWAREATVYGHENEYLFIECTYESNISAFADLFHSMCFDGRNEKPSDRLVKYARQLIKRCREKNLKSRPTMKEVVVEMETWI